MAAPLYIHPNSAKTFPFLYTLTNTCYLLSFWWSHSNRYEIIAHNNFNWHLKIYWSIPAVQYYINYRCIISVQFSSVTQSCPTLCGPMNQHPMSITNSRSLLKLTPIESVMPSSHLILCLPLLLLPPISPSIRVFSSESTLRMRWPKYWSFSFSISPSNEHPAPLGWTYKIYDDKK